MNQVVTQLQSKFGLGKRLSFKDIGEGFLIMEVNTDKCTASIALQGAQVMTWQPKTQAEPILWMSEAATLKQGKSIRGGMPICWPWFGAHPSDPSFAAHGIARTAQWDVKQTSVTELGEVEIVLGLAVEQHQQYKHKMTAEVVIRMGKQLSLTLTTHNQSDEELHIGQAIHTYFHVGDVREVSVHGLEESEYIDKLSLSPAYQKQQGSISIASEVDRIYLDDGQDVLLEDKSLQRTLRIQKQGSHSTIVWNPWIDKTKALGDMGEDDAYLHMLCIESANAADDVVILPAGEKHALFVQYSFV